MATRYLGVSCEEVEEEEWAEERNKSDNLDL